MQDIINRINDYCEAHSMLDDHLLMKISRETHLKTLSPRMLSGHLQGSLLIMISQLIRPRRILEIGTFTGYSALCLVKGMVDDGELITIDIDAETSHLAQSYFDESRHKYQIKMIVDDAKNVIPKLDDGFDLVFIDADKEAYSQYFDLVIPKCVSGALIIADNILWSGKVLEQIKDRKTQAIDDFNKKIYADPRVSNVILPIRDGISLIRVI